MLNLSDKELDRLSREAADHHDPGDLLGPRAWDRLELRLDKDLGRVGGHNNPLRGIKRFPFHYAPVLLLVAGVTWFAIRQFNKAPKAEASGSPPTAAAQAPRHGQTNNPSSTQIPDNAYTTTSTPPGSKNAAAPDDKTISTAHISSDSPSSAASQDAHTALPGSAVSHGNSSSGGSGSSGDTKNRNLTADHFPSSTASAGANAAGDMRSSRSRVSYLSGRTTASVSGSSHLSGRSAASRTASHTAHPSGRSSTPGSTAGSGTASAATNPNAASLAASPARAQVQSPKTPHGHYPAVSDSALRAYHIENTAAAPAKSPSLKINRALQFGVLVAPDFSSVNSLAGDRPGSSLGLTLDYQLWNRWHIGTGLLYTKKNYTARVQDYHVPHDYFRMNSMSQVDFVKGSLKMLEIPIDVRYDFSVTGNTILFASVGTSSYFFPSEKAGYYFNSFGREACRNFTYKESKNDLFSAIDLSIGVEAGISNSLSLLLAPYVKVPTGNIGFGEIKMNSVGIDFGLRYSPVLSRKRH